jgi:hypothetical protein
MGVHARQADGERASPAPEETAIWMLLPSEAKHPGALEPLRRWLSLGRRVVVVAAREPYPLAVCSETPCQVAIYGDAACSLSALAEVLVGQAESEGRLPVSLVMSPRNRYNA